MQDALDMGHPTSPGSLDDQDPLLFGGGSAEYGTTLAICIQVEATEEGTAAAIQVEATKKDAAAAIHDQVEATEGTAADIPVEVGGGIEQRGQQQPFRWRQQRQSVCEKTAVFRKKTSKYFIKPARSAGKINVCMQKLSNMPKNRCW